MIALVTGATGFIGYEVARQLVEAGVATRALVRRQHRAPLLNPFDVELVSGDLGDSDSLRRACEGVDTVYHLAARATFESEVRLRSTIVAGSARLLEAAADAGVRMVVFSSSLLVYGDQPTGVITAATPVAPAVAYGRIKIEAERYLAELAADRDIGLAIVRLPHVYGARDLMFAQLYRRWSMLPGLRADAYAHLHVSDAARLLIAMGTQGWTGASPAGDQTNASWDEFFGILRRYYPGHHVLRTPGVIAAPVAGLVERVTRVLSKPSMVTRDTVHAAELRLPVQPDLLWSQLGLQPRYPSVREGIPASLDELVAYRWRHPVRDRT